MVTEQHLSERHVCASMGLSRYSYRHTSEPSVLNVQLRDHIVLTAHAHRRWR